MENSDSLGNYLLIKYLIFIHNIDQLFIYWWFTIVFFQLGILKLYFNSWEAR